MSYDCAVPVVPSSPGAVQVSWTLFLSTATPLKSVIAAGGVASAASAVVACTTFDTTDQLGTSSAVFIAM